MDNERKRVENAWRLAQMATDTVAGIERANTIWRLYLDGMLTAREALERL